jgi:tRNA (guanine-N7-)-methyltransferase
MNNLYIWNYGCGKGGFISKLAVKNPKINYLGIDIKSEVLGLAKRNVEKEYLEAKREIDNVLLTAYEIEIIQNILNENDKVDRIYINFCNPWPKPRHNKKRLTHTKQIEKYKIFLSKNAQIYFKTDDENLFNASIKYFEESGFKVNIKLAFKTRKSIFDLCDSIIGYDIEIKW